MVAEIRRETDALIVQQIWAAIQYIRLQKQMPNGERIARYMEREHEMTFDEAEQHLLAAVEEDLVESYTHPGMKGIKRISLAQQGFKIPDTDENWDKGSHDWYCFECHKNGSVICCTECYRVYHPECITSDIDDEESFICFVCQQQESARTKPRIRRKELNRLLYFAVGRLKEKTKELHKMGMKNEPKQFRRFMYQCMDLNTMEQKTLCKKYKYIEQFKADAQTLYHNVFICYGEAGGMAQLARIMIVDCQYDLDEIELCKDCYYFSNAKPNDWFALPCNPRHELVFAKQKGFCYWPAKVIQIISTGYDVRFFGGLHQRAIIPESNIRPIESSEKSLNIKKSAAYLKSMEELKRHQQHLLSSDPLGEEDFEQDDDDIEETPIATPPPAKRGRKPKQHYVEEDTTDSEAKSTPAPAKRGRKPKSLETKMDTNSWQQEQKPTTPYTGKKRGRKPLQRVVVEDEETVSEDFSELSPKSSPEGKRKARAQVMIEDIDNRISSSIDKQVMTPEDNNMVTSSEDNIQPSRIISTKDSTTQTSKKLSYGGRMRGTQTDDSGSYEGLKPEDNQPTCDCDLKYDDIIKQLKEEHLEQMKSLEKTLFKHAEDGGDNKDEALSLLREELQKTFEQDKQQAVSRAISNMQRESEKGKRSIEDKMKLEFMEEMKKLAQKHKNELSVTKKKQWCYNCEEEAMYHCCWNTSYCSIKCQQENWHKEHKRMCRRKR